MAKKIARKAEEKPRLRSPNYPATSLPDAVDRVRKLYEADGKAGSAVEMAVKRIGYNSTHGLAMTMLSALKKFKLIDYQNKRVVPTSIAIDIIQFPAGHQRRVQALKTAALGPDIIRELYEQFLQHGNFPADDALRPELITDKGFSDKAVDAFIEDLRSTLIFAGLMDQNRVLITQEPMNGKEPESHGQISKSNHGDAMTPATHQQMQQLPAIVRHESAWPGPTVSFDLPRGNTIEIRLKAKVSPDEFAKIKKIFELSEFAFVDDEPALPTPIVPTVPVGCNRIIDA